MQDLGSLRLHAGALTRCEDDDGGRAIGAHGYALRLQVVDTRRIPVGFADEMRTGPDRHRSGPALERSQGRNRTLIQWTKTICPAIRRPGKARPLIGDYVQFSVVGITGAAPTMPYHAPLPRRCFPVLAGACPYLPLLDGASRCVSMRLPRVFRESSIGGRCRLRPPPARSRSHPTPRKTDGIFGGTRP